jgi:thymidylate kinase
VNPMIERVFRAFEEADVQWCLLRGEAELEAPPKDVDLLVARRDVDGLRSVLGALGFAQLPSHGYDHHCFFLTYHAESDSWIKLDVVDELRFGGDYTLETGAEDKCLAHRQQHGELTLLDPDSAFWALLLHCLLDKQAVDARHRPTLVRLAAFGGADGPLGRVAGSACPPEWTPTRIVEAVIREDWPALLALAPLLEARWPRRAPAPSRLQLKAARLVNRFERPGLSVAFLAPDGAGKTTLAGLLEDSFHFPVRTVYMGLDQRPPGGRKRGRRPPGVGLARRLATVWSRYLDARLHEVQGGLVVFDRYTYDVLLPPKQPLSTGRRLRRWLLAHACPEPDLVLVLDAPGEVLHGRKPEHPVAVLEEQRRYYRRLGERLNGAVVVDASRELDEVRREVQSVIWQALAARIARD